MPLRVWFPRLLVQASPCAFNTSGSVKSISSLFDTPPRLKQRAASTLARVTEQSFAASAICTWLIQWRRKERIPQMVVSQKTKFKDSFPPIVSVLTSIAAALSPCVVTCCHLAGLSPRTGAPSDPQLVKPQRSRPFPHRAMQLLAGQRTVANGLSNTRSKALLGSRSRVAVLPKCLASTSEPKKLRGGLIALPPAEGKGFGQASGVRHAGCGRHASDLTANVLKSTDIVVPEEDFKEASRKNMRSVSVLHAAGGQSLERPCHAYRPRDPTPRMTLLLQHPCPGTWLPLRSKPVLHQY